MESCTNWKDEESPQTNYVYYWTDEDGKRPEEPTFKSEVEAKTYADKFTHGACCDPTKHEWNRLATAWEELFSSCLVCGLTREVS